MERPKFLCRYQTGGTRGHCVIVGGGLVFKGDFYTLFQGVPFVPRVSYPLEKRLSLNWHWPHFTTAFLHVDKEGIYLLLTTRVE